MAEQLGPIFDEESINILCFTRDVLIRLNELGLRLYHPTIEPQLGEDTKEIADGKATKRPGNG